MDESKTVTLRKDDTPKLYSVLRAQIDEHANLVIEGHDIGRFVEQALASGDDEYEYYVAVDSQYKDRILLLLLQEVFNPEGKRFSSDVDWRHWLDEHGIPTRFFCY